MKAHSIDAEQEKGTRTHSPNKAVNIDYYTKPILSTKEINIVHYIKPLYIIFRASFS